MVSNICFLFCHKNELKKSDEDPQWLFFSGRLKPVTSQLTNLFFTGVEATPWSHWRSMPLQSIVQKARGWRQFSDILWEWTGPNDSYSYNMFLHMLWIYKHMHTFTCKVLYVLNTPKWGKCLDPDSCAPRMVFLAITIHGHTRKLNSYLRMPSNAPAPLRSSGILVILTISCNDFFLTSEPVSSTCKSGLGHLYSSLAIDHPWYFLICNDLSIGNGWFVLFPLLATLFTYIGGA